MRVPPTMKSGKGSHDPRTIRVGKRSCSVSSNGSPHDCSHGPGWSHPGLSCFRFNPTHVAFQVKRGRKSFCLPTLNAYYRIWRPSSCGNERAMKLRRKRFQKGSVQLDPRTNVWSFRYRDTNGERKAERIGTRQQYRTKSSAEVAAVAIRERIFGAVKTEAVTLDRVADRYEAERMPGRHTTSRGYKGKLKIIRAKWGKYPLPLNPPEVELWLKEVRTVKGTLYSKKSREGIKSLLCILHDASMFFQYLPYTANPMELVKVPPVKGAPKKKKRIVLTKDDFRLLLAKFVGMYRVMVLLAGCVGLRRSEIFGLKWSDFNWLKNEIFIQRSTVEGYEDECKTES